ncbi:MAG: hypothetical protein LBJ11_05070, partial [Oscillospiraceae bacterium]|nr:hypothetical protein [Oscillospiraceae bacterium]
MWQWKQGSKGNGLPLARQAVFRALWGILGDGLVTYLLVENQRVCGGKYGRDRYAVFVQTNI